jgi:hypothetical protein
MKIKINNYVFNPTIKTIVFSDYTNIKLDDIILITDVTTGTIIYNFAASNLTGSVLGNILTLNYDTTSLVNSTQLSIYYDDNTTNQSTDESIILLRRLVKLSETLAVQDSFQRQRVTVEGFLNVSTFASVDIRYHFIDLARTAYATGIRAKIINS